MASSTNRLSLLSYSYKKTPTKSGRADSTKEQCSICLSDFEVRERVTGLPCSHLFHTQCINEWIAKSPKCPMCRAIVHQQSTVSGHDEIGIHRQEDPGAWDDFHEVTELPLELLRMYDSPTSSDDSDSDSEDMDDISSPESSMESDSESSVESDVEYSRNSSTDSSVDISDEEDDTDVSSRSSSSCSPRSINESESDASQNNSSSWDPYWSSRSREYDVSDSESALSCDI